MRIFLSLSLNVTRDIIRQPVIAMLTVVCIITIGMLPVVAVFGLGQEERIVRDSALASIFVYGLFLVVASSISSIFKQIQNGTASVVLSKPVSREFFLAATFCGIAFACAIFAAINVMSAMLSVRMAFAGILTDWGIGMIFAFSVLLAFGIAGMANYCGRNFCSALFKSLFLCLLAALIVAAFVSPHQFLILFAESAHRCACDGHGGVCSAGYANFGQFICWRLLPAGLLVFCALAMLAAIAVVLSTRFKPAIVLLCCCLVFIVGLISDYLFFTVMDGGMAAQICSALLPNWQSFGIYEALDISFIAAWKSVLQACGYALLYICAVLCFGVLSFKNAEI